MRADLILLGIVPLAMAATAPGPRPRPLFSQPLDCRFGVDCFVQQYFDHDPGPKAKDYRCGSRVYDGHDGIDLRIPTLAAQRGGVAVLAAAPGVVRNVRDGMADRVADRADRSGVAGRECGNGVVIAHEGGWETQYCHMARGSIAVKPGEPVAAGARLGQIGMSGDTEFPHLHFSVRHDGVKVDPFAADAPPGRCGGKALSLWTSEAADALAYRRSEVINAGFAEGAVQMQAIEEGAVATPGRSSPALVAFVRMIGLRTGDVVALKLRAPDGSVLAESTNPSLERDKAQWLIFVGRKRPGRAWPAGRYRAEFMVSNAGAPILTKRFGLIL